MVKWGILGTANVARWGMIPGMKAADNCELYAIAGRNADKAEAFKTQFGFKKAYASYEELLKDEEVQAVYVPLPNDIHKKWVIAALRAGKHVLCEKPMAMNAKESREMYAVARECGRFLMEAYAYLHSPYVQSLREVIDSGVIGRVNYIDTAFVTQGYKEDFRLHREFGGGAMYDLGCYCTTMILSLIDSKPDFVKACAEYTDLGVDFLMAGIIRFTNGARASFNAGMNLGSDSNSRFDRLYIHGSRGSIRSEVEYNQKGEVSYRIFTNEGVTEKRVMVPDNYALEAAQFSRCIEGGEQPRITPEFSIQNAELIDSILKEMGY